jgi:ubiquinone/menaquinone biosynthesis C-methylase UbiE
MSAFSERPAPGPAPGPRTGPIRDRLNAWLLASSDETTHRQYGRRKRELFADLPSALVEIGPGAGANFRYYPPGTRVIAFEPNPALHDRLRQAAADRGIELDLRAGSAEALDLPDASVEAVVATLVLCTVPDPRRVVAEARRVLRPGGRFLFIEHVAAPAGSALRALQRIVRSPWRWLSEGCCVDRDTAALLAAAGFTALHVEPFQVPTPLLPVRPHIVGEAVR